MVRCSRVDSKAAGNGAGITRRFEPLTGRSEPTPAADARPLEAGDVVVTAESDIAVENSDAKSSRPGMPMTTNNVRVAEIYFESGDATVSTSGRNRLTNAGSRIAELKPRAILVAGFTDRVGSAEANQRLAKQRVEAVVKILRDPRRHCGGSRRRPGRARDPQSRPGWRRRSQQSQGLGRRPRRRAGIQAGYYKAVRERYVQDGNFSYADQLDDAVRARNSQWMANQSLFDRYLRPMMTFIEGFVFAATPILSLLIPIGMIGIGAAGRFLLVGAWIQLWMPALAIVNLFLHDVVAGKMAALADAGTPLTSLAGLQQGDDIIQTWLATGGLMASAVPVLTLMLVYGGAISANFFATRLQGEDVVMERQAAGATFNPFERLHVDPARTFDRTAGIAAQTGAESRLDYFSYSSRAGSLHESATDARMQAVDQFAKDLRQSVSSSWATQASASVTQGSAERWVAEGGSVESAVQQNFGDTIRDIMAQTGMSDRQATEVAGSLGISSSLGLQLPSLSSLFGTSAGGGVGGTASAEVSGRQTWSIDDSQAEQWRAQISDKIAQSDEVRASMMESVAADIQGSTSDFYLSAETLGRDETLTASAQDVVSAGRSYSEAVSVGASMDATRNVSAKILVPAIAASPQAVTELNDVIVQNGLAGEVQTYEHFHGERDAESFGGNAGLAHIYAQAHVASQHIGSGDERSARIQGGLADAFQSAEGFGGYAGDASANAALMDSARSYGAIANNVGGGIASGPPGLEAYEQDLAAIRDDVQDRMTAVPSADQANRDVVGDEHAKHMNDLNDQMLKIQQAYEKGRSGD